jgi:hypothetical protein
MKTVKAKAPTALLKTARIGSTLSIYDNETAVKVEAALLRQARRTGDAVQFADRRVWFRTTELIDTSKTGSAQYIWAADGNRVKCSITRITVYKDGRTEEKAVGTSFCKLDDE